VSKGVERVSSTAELLKSRRTFLTPAVAGHALC
jgi:hypothetical protein